MESVRLLPILAAALLSGCARPSAPVEHPKTDPAEQAFYGETVEQLVRLNREAESFLRSGKSDQAAAMITKGQPLSSRLLSVPQPTLAAMEAASDLDHLYGRMLLANRHYGWARLVFQKNVSRWRGWKPQTPETARRLKLADSAVAECDRLMAE